MNYFAINDLQSQLLLAFLVLTLTWILLRYFKTPKNLPPGPWGLPFVGHKFLLGKKPQITIAKMRKQYGDVIKLNMGREYIVFLTSYKAIKEALAKQADIFAGRPTLNLTSDVIQNPGIIKGNGEIWSELRRFSLSKLRDFGFGKSSLEPQIMEEIQHFLEILESFNGQPIPNVGEHLRRSVTNVICILMSGKRFDYQDPVLNKMLGLTSEGIRRSGINRISSLIPLAFRHPFLLKILRIQTALPFILELRNMIKSVVNNHADKPEELTENSFIDVWLTEALNKSTHSKYLTKDQLPEVLFDLFIAGSDTTTNSLGWSLLFMIDNSDIQAKAQKEIDDVIGKERTPSMSDQKLMPFIEAILMEVSRIITIVPLSVQHRTEADTTLLGKFIPKGTTVVPNLWAVHHDPEIFPEPEKFKPERFLTENGQLKRMDEVIPFSLGKRQCMGESLARMELFLYFTTMLQHFTFKKVNETVDFDYDFAAITLPRAQPMCAIRR